MFRPLKKQTSKRRGVTVVLAALTMVGVFAFVAFTVDIGHIVLKRMQLQNAGDAAAHAGLLELVEFPNDPDVITGFAYPAVQESAVGMAEFNMPGEGEVLKGEDVVVGQWDFDARTFTATNVDPNAIKVTLRRSETNSNPLELFFAPVIGHTHANTEVTSICAMEAPESYAFGYVVDEDTIDSDVPAIEDLAMSLGVAPDDMITDYDGDGFIDIPHDSVIEVPTGQVGDEGFWNVLEWGTFPFHDEADYTHLDFLAEGTALESLYFTTNLTDVEWTSANAPHWELIGTKVMDKVVGVTPEDDHQTLLDMDHNRTIYVAPVYKSDVNTAETDPATYGSPASNLLGERRGLVAFYVESTRPHPAGGSYLPLLTIRIVVPDGTADDFGFGNKVTLGDGGGDDEVFKPQFVFVY